MKVLSWNVRRAGTQSEAVWNVFDLINPDIACLQEVTSVPDWIQTKYDSCLVAPKYFTGIDAPYNTAVLSRWPIDSKRFLESSLDWVNKIHDKQYGWLLECTITAENQQQYRVISVHSPAERVPKSVYQEIDISAVKLPQNPDLWFTEILWSLLKDTYKDTGQKWIVGGDFNTSIHFDKPRDRGNQEVIARMNHCGFEDCLSKHHAEYVPTFRHSRGRVTHQLDYCYVNSPLLKQLRHVSVLGRAEVFQRKPMLSDHLPIICEFD